MTFRAKHDWVCIMGVILAAGLGVMTVLVVVVLWMFGGIPSLATQRVEAPDGRPYAVVVRESRDLIDPIYDVSIDTVGPIGLSWDVGCVNGDYQGLVDLTWRSPTELAVTIIQDDNDITVTVHVDSTGRVIGTVPRTLVIC